MLHPRRRHPGLPGPPARCRARSGRRRRDGGDGGEHQGTHGFTIGQRKGLGIAVGDQRPRYVLGIEPVTRTVTVGTAEQTGVDEVVTGRPSWTGPAPVLPLEAVVQLRAHGTPVPCTVSAGRTGW
ncbi:tRNA methyl transferase PRC-barrel domain-containing protein [Klenkia terrae]|uniref:tRNA methyl transferase PRC-barrel domain-containing protein n=1 Tax=Klenkia terrae TaxID=1052259 RepID=UPI0036146C2F